jgi:hypothetical protein
VNSVPDNPAVHCQQRFRNFRITGDENQFILNQWFRRRDIGISYRFQYTGSFFNIPEFDTL